MARVKEVSATLEELMDKEGLKRIRKAEEEYRKGKFETVRNSGEIERLLSE